MKKVLIVVDMQNDFITGVLGNKECREVVPCVVKKTEASLKAGDTVVFTRDTHDDAYMDSEEGKNLPVKHCIEGSEGWEIIPELKALLDGSEQVEAGAFLPWSGKALKEGGVCIADKPIFGSTKLGELLKSLAAEEEPSLQTGRDLQIELIGVCTDICVISNALLMKAYLPNAHIKVDAACCAGVTPESHRTALEAMKACHIEVAGAEADGSANR